MGLNLTPPYTLAADSLADRLTLAKTLGVDWVRISYEVHWETSYPTTSIYAQYVKAFQNAGFKVLECIQGIDLVDAQSQDNLHCTAKNLTALAHWVSRVTTMGAYPNAIEIGNEWNANFFMKDVKANITMLQKMIRQASVSLKQAYPTLPLVHVGIVPYLDDNAGYDPVKFLQALLALDPHHLDAFNAIGWHPYTYPGNPVTETDTYGWVNHTKKIQAYLTSIGKSLPFWFTEYGTPTAGGPNAVSVAGQGAHQDLYYQSFDNLRSDATTPVNVARDFVFELNDDGVSYYEGNMGVYAKSVNVPVTTTLRPSATLGSAGITLFGAAGTLHGTLADNKDLSYAHVEPPPGASASLVGPSLVLPPNLGNIRFLPFTIPPGAVLNKVTLRFRVRRGSVPATIHYQINLGPEQIKSYSALTPGTWTTLTATGTSTLNKGDVTAGVTFAWAIGDYQADMSEAYLDVNWTPATVAYTVKQPIHDVIVARAKKPISSVLPPPPTSCD